MRDALVAAVLADPGDDLSVAALADWHEERGLCGIAAALRLALALRAVPFPAEPDGPCRDLVGAKGRDELSGRPLWFHTDGYRWIWPWKCQGWNNVAKLPAFEAVRRMPIDVGFGEEADAWRRRAAAFVACCELYACGVTSACDVRRLRHDQGEAERAMARAMDRADPTDGDRLRAAVGSLAAARLLGGGPATRAMGAMVEAERPTRRELRRLRYTPRSDLATRTAAMGRLILLRTYNRSLVRTLLAAEPWRIGPAVYEDLAEVARWRR